MSSGLTPQVSGVTVRPLVLVVPGRLFGQLTGSRRPERLVDPLATAVPLKAQ
jgi:hypothetical protein